MALKLITAATPIVGLEAAKRHLRVFHEDDDGDIDALVAAATGWIDGKDGWLGLTIGTQTWDYILDRFPTGTGNSGGISIPLPPLQSVTGVYYVDPDSGTEATMDPATYEVDNVSAPGWVMPGASGWPAAMETINAVRVRFVAGYETVPAPIVHAVKLMVGHFYEHREAVTDAKLAEMPIGVNALLMPYRNWAA